MTTHDKRVGIGAFLAALVGALQWKVLLLWLLVMLVPTTIAALPIRDVLGGLLDHSVHAAGMARGFDAILMSDLMVQVARQGVAIGTAGMLASLLTMLLAPFLAGMIVSALRAPQHAAGLGELMHGGLREYWRMFRLMLWSLLAFGIAIAVAAAAFGIASKSIEAATLQSVADRSGTIALWISVVFFVLAHAAMESSRAQFAADAGLTSATRAFGRGVGMLFRRPLATLGMYLGTSVIGYVLVIFIGMWRIHTPAVGAFGVVLAFVIAQLIVVVLAWQRVARLHGLTAIARAAGNTSRRGAYPSLATA